jgi:hypothetical protein
MTTCRRFKDRVGYRGQKYAVVGDREDGSKTTLGYQNADTIGDAWNKLAHHFRLRNLRLEEMKQGEQADERKIKS